MTFLTWIGQFVLKFALEKGASFLIELYKVQQTHKKIDKEVDEEVDTHKKVIEEVKEHKEIVKEIKDGKKKKEPMTDEQRKRLRETQRKLVGGIFS